MIPFSQELLCAYTADWPSGGFVSMDDGLPGSSGSTVVQIPPAVARGVG